MTPEHIASVLRPLNLPLQYQARPKMEPKKIRTVLSFDLFRAETALHGDGRILQTETSVQIDVFSYGDTSETAKAVKQRLLAAGFRFDYEMSSNDSLSGFRIYHRILFFNIVERED